MARVGPKRKNVKRYTYDLIEMYQKKFFSSKTKTTLVQSEYLINLLLTVEILQHKDSYTILKNIQGHKKHGKSLQNFIRNIHEVCRQQFKQKR